MMDKYLKKSLLQESTHVFRVLEIVEDKAGNLWFGTSEGLIKYNGKEFTTFSKKEGLQNEEIWGLTIDKSGLIWVGSTGGVNQFDGEKFIPFFVARFKSRKCKNLCYLTNWFLKL